MCYTKIITAVFIMLFNHSLSVKGQTKKPSPIAAFEMEVIELQKKLKIPGLSYAIVSDGK